MELLSNLAWVIVALTLWGFWFAGWRRRDKDSRLSAVAVQVIALAMLTVVLLPVISVTDDLQACNTPVEVDRYSRKSEIHPSTDPSSAALPQAIALFYSCLTPHCVRAVAYLAHEDSQPQSMHGSLRAVWIRPPPMA
ncbi:MAG TPA: hypothetical protein VHX60_03010 [Acidobacteriaceae bacterium]|nr:hypothetical protein [Acidobacteriaceae bacterium]